MIITGITIILTLCIIMGWGSVFPAPSIETYQPMHRISLHLLVGTSLLIIQLQIAHFFWPIQKLISIYVISIGMVFFLFRRKCFIQLYRSLNISALYLLSAVILCAYLSSPKISIAAYDSQWYHLPAIQWINKEAAIQGFANFQHRFGFNNTNFLLISLFSIWSDRLYQVLNGMWLLILILYGIYGVSGYTTANTREEKISGAYRAMSLMYLSFLSGITSPHSYLNTAPELMAGVFILLSIDLLIFSRSDSTASLSLAFLGIIVAASVKISGILIMPIMIAYMISRKGLARFRSIESKIQLALAVLLISAWFFRSWWFSGYILFPAEMSAIVQVNHQVPIIETQSAADYIYNFARHTYSINGQDIYVPNSSIYSWIAQKSGIYWLINIIAALLLLGIALVKSKKADSSFLIPIIFTALAIITAFMTAPDYRFIWYYFCTLNGLAFAYYVSARSTTTIKKSNRLLDWAYLLVNPKSLFISSLLFMFILVPSGRAYLEGLGLFTPQQLAKLDRFPNIYARPEIVLLPEETGLVVSAEEPILVAVRTKSADSHGELTPLRAIIPQPKPLCGSSKAFCLAAEEAARSIVIFTDADGHIKRVEHARQ